MDNECMRLKDYESRDGKRVWLSNDELDTFIEESKTPQQRLAFLMAGRAGLRRNELLHITPADIVDGTGGPRVRVWEDHAKRDKYREPPIPAEMANIANTLAYDLEPDDALIGVEAGTTVYRWVRRAAERRQAETNDAGWQFLDVHDLRRTWGTGMLEQGVLPSVVMEWGGWEDWETFRAHYLGEFSPEALRRERNKVSFLGGDPESEHTASPGKHPGQPQRAKPHWVD